MGGSGNVGGSSNTCDLTTQLSDTSGICRLGELWVLSELAREQ